MERGRRGGDGVTFFFITNIDSITRRRKFIISNSFFKSENPGNKPAVKKHINSITALQSGKASGLEIQISLASVSAQTYSPQRLIVSTI